MTDQAGDSAVLVITVGGFGHRVGRVVRDATKGRAKCHTWTEDTTRPVVGAGCGAVVLAAPHGARRPSLELAEEAARRGVPFLPLILSGPKVRIGPVVTPAGGPCYRCFERRARQHDARPDEAETVADYYDSHPRIEPAGFLDATAWFAAYRAIDLLSRAQATPRRFSGRVWVHDLLTRAVVCGRVTGVDGCDACGLGLGGDARTMGRMRRALRPLLEPAWTPPREVVRPDWTKVRPLPLVELVP